MFCTDTIPKRLGHRAQQIQTECRDLKMLFDWTSIEYHTKTRYLMLKYDKLCYFFVKKCSKKSLDCQSFYICHEQHPNLSGESGLLCIVRNSCTVRLLLILLWIVVFITVIRANTNVKGWGKLWKKLHQYSNSQNIIGTKISQAFIVWWLFVVTQKTFDLQVECQFVQVVQFFFLHFILQIVCFINLKLRSC